MNFSASKPEFAYFCSLALFAVSLISPSGAPAQAKLSGAALPPITLDEFLNTTDIVGARISPDGNAAVIGTESPDWKAGAYRHTLWLWTAKDGLRALTQSGSDEGAEWSPDGQWVAFLSDRPVLDEEESDGKDSGGDSASGDAKAASYRAKNWRTHPHCRWLTPQKIQDQPKNPLREAAKSPAIQSRPSPTTRKFWPPVNSKSRKSHPRRMD